MDDKKRLEQTRLQRNQQDQTRIQTYPILQTWNAENRPLVCSAGKQ